MYSQIFLDKTIRMVLNVLTLNKEILVRYETKKLKNGKFSVIDTSITEGMQAVAWGMTQEQAEAQAARLNVRANWGK